MGSITDIPGIRVGHVQKTGAGWLTGVTVILPPPGTVGSVDVRGGGPATHETDALDPTTLVSTVDAVVLTGGSAYGLASAHGAQRWCEENNRGFAVSGGVVPIVPAAAVFDLGRGGDFTARPGAAMGYAAAAAAAARQDGHEVERGNVGAGTGAAIGRGKFKGGVGTASITLDDGIVVGALAVVNALGLPFGTAPQPGTAQHGTAQHGTAQHGTAQHGTAQPQTEAAGSGQDRPLLNTTLVVLATNAVLDKVGCRRTASAAHAGIARALNPSHTLADGDTVFCLATGAAALDRSSAAAWQLGLMALQGAAADAVRLAILDGIAAARPVSTPAGRLDAYPGLSALR